MMITIAEARGRKLKGYKMKKILLVILVIIFVVVGCNSLLAPDAANNNNDKREINKQDVTEDLTRLADVDFVIVPEYVYHVLHEEKLDNNYAHLIRRYVKYDGNQNKAEETLQLIPLPQKCTNTREAKIRLLAVDPEQLALYPHTYLSEKILAEWEEEKYKAEIELENAVTLAELKSRGAVGRLNEMFAIKKPAGDLVTLIEIMEEKYLPKNESVHLARELNPLPRSLLYRLELTEPGREEEVGGRIYVSFSVDELGNPLELVFETAYNNVQGVNTENEIAAFILKMREILINNLGLPWLQFGVLYENHPQQASLAYANVTLYYEGEKEATYFTEKIFLQ